MKQWATCTFDCDVDVQTLVFGRRVLDWPRGDDATLLVPVHAYLYEDHSKQKGAHMANGYGNKDWQTTSAYFDGRNNAEKNFGPSWHEGRLSIDSDTMKAWDQDPDGNWTLLGSRDGPEKDHFDEFDTMTEIQYDDAVDLGTLRKGEVLEQWRWVRDADGSWHRPENVLTLQDGSNNDDTNAKIDFAVDQADGRFYFYHYVET